MQQPVADGIRFERVGTAEVDRGTGWRLDEKEARHGVDFGVDRAAGERQAVLVRFGDHQLTRVSGRTSTCPIRPTAMSAREESSVCSQSPTRSRPDAASRVVPISGRPARAVTSQALRSARAISRNTSTAAAASGTQYQRRRHAPPPTVPAESRSPATNRVAARCSSQPADGVL